MTIKITEEMNVQSEWALESYENFMLFDEAFNFDNTDTIEQLKARGCK